MRSSAALLILHIGSFRLAAFCTADKPFLIHPALLAFADKATFVAKRAENATPGHLLPEPFEQLIMRFIRTQYHLYSAQSSTGGDGSPGPPQSPAG